MPRNTHGAGLLLRVRTYLTRRQLDEQLTEGADPDTSAALRLRADQLRSNEGRARIADRLQRVLDEAHAPVSPPPRAAAAQGGDPRTRARAAGSHRAPAL